MNTRLAVNGDLPAWAVILALALAFVSLGVLAMYVLCSNYKDDQVHAPFLMRRRAGALVP